MEVKARTGDLATRVKKHEKRHSASFQSVPSEAEFKHIDQGCGLKDGPFIAGNN